MGLPLSQGGENGQGTYSWGSDYMGLNELKKQAASSGYTRRVTVAVVDTGIDTSNVLFAGRKVSLGIIIMYRILLDMVPM